MISHDSVVRPTKSNVILDVSNKLQRRLNAAYINNPSMNMIDALKSNFELTKKIDAKLNLFCELMLTAYKLQDATELFTLDHSNLVNNDPCTNVLKDLKYAAHINAILLPAVFDEVHKHFGVSTDA
jgi:hypothetical protein